MMETIPRQGHDRFVNRLEALEFIRGTPHSKNKRKHLPERSRVTFQEMFFAGLARGPINKQF
jgi:hypothetical protein